MKDILFALWFFLPAGVSNVTPILAVKVPGLRNWNTPVDFGHSYRGVRLLGDHKTWRGMITGISMGVLAAMILATLNDTYAWPSGFLGNYAYLHGGTMISIGLLLSVGALVGDAVESFFKRQIQVPSGKSWFPFDQLDYIIGGLLFAAIQIRLTFTQYALVFVLWFGIHLAMSYLGFWLKLKKDPI